MNSSQVNPYPEVDMITVEVDNSLYGFQRGEDQRGNWYLILGSCPVLFNQGSSGRHKIIPAEFAKELVSLAVSQGKGTIRDFSLYPVAPPREKKHRDPNAPKNPRKTSRMVGIPLSAILGV